MFITKPEIKQYFIGKENETSQTALTYNSCDIDQEARINTPFCVCHDNFLDWQSELATYGVQVSIDENGNWYDN